MIIAIDGYEANQRVRVGSGRYAYELLCHIYKYVRSNWYEAGSIDHNTAFRIYLPNKPLADMPAQTPWWQYRVAKPVRLWTFFGLPGALSLDKPHADVVFTPTHYIPRFITTPRVMSIMDLSYLHYPELFRKQDLHKLVNWTAYSARNAHKIFTISQFSANAIIQTYHRKKEDVVVTYPGFVMSAQSQPAESVLAKYALPKRYILSVGTLQPRKNYEKLIEAFSSLAKKTAYADVGLYIVGKKGWLYEHILAAPEKFGVSDKVKFLDYVPDSDLPSLYTHAVCLALPSLYEGFGLPVLEAMAHKCPVVVSNISSLPEIAQDAGIYVEPTDVGSIAQGLLTALSEDATAKRDQRVKKGLEQTKKFSWEKAARQTLDILTEVGGKS